MPIYAGIDIGTLTLRFLVADIDEHGGLHELTSERRIVRLGERLEPGRQLQAAPMKRAAETLRTWVSHLRESDAERVTAVATSAVRDAVNREEFLALVKREVGLDVEVLSGKEEARRTLLGIQSGLPVGVEEFLALDIGGGSTEFMRVSPTAPVRMKSIDQGVVRLTEECFHHEPVTTEDLANARARIRSHLGTVAEEFGTMKGAHLVGTAGSITTLAAMDQRLDTYAPVRIHNYRLSVEAVRRIAAELIPLSATERRALPGLEPGREDVILAGALFLEEVMERFDFRECLVSDYGLREGILIDLWQKTRTRSM